MKLCITSEGKTLDSRVDPRFGRCPFFIFADTESGAFSALDNPGISQSGGAGIQAAQFVASQGVKTVLTGHAGPNAFRTLEAAGISVVTGVAGSVKEAIEKFKKGELLPPASGPDVSSHFGSKIL
jgi:predicted Fe-Mo cluster-binding NifX family protein